MHGSQLAKNIYGGWIGIFFDKIQQFFQDRYCRQLYEKPAVV